MGEMRNEISNNFQIKKFCLYGFLKNLKFFEPFLLIYLMAAGLSLLQIGLLYSVREIIVNIMEVPSGVLADSIGRKRILVLCFVFYIISFIFFFFCSGFGLAVVAMVFFGLGEAFRSGTHKAMIYTYLDIRGWSSEKTFVYGRTRSFSLIGTTVSSLVAIVIVIFASDSRDVFLFAIIPYILDFFLILSYPDELNKDERSGGCSFVEVLTQIKNSLFRNRNLRKILFNEGIFEAVISSIKDFVQPIMEVIIVGSGFLLFTSITAEDNLKIILAVIYAVISIAGATASRRSYLLEQLAGTGEVLNGLYLLLGLSLAMLGIFIRQPLLVAGLYFLINIILNARKPVYVKQIDEYMDCRERASILSMASQLKSLLVIVIAPLIGYIADTRGIAMVMFLLAGLVLLTMPVVMIGVRKD